MKASHLREKTDEELLSLLEECNRELFNLRFQKAIDELNNPARIKEVKRDIARIKTILREREIAARKEKV